MEKGIRVKTSSFTRHHVNITMTQAKAGPITPTRSSPTRKRRTTATTKALLLDTDGFVAEGSGENIFLVINGVLYTPELTTALDGITRDTVFTLAAEMGIPVNERRITRDEVYIADEAFFTGTAAEVTPIRELDNRAIGSGKRGPITTGCRRCSSMS